MFASEVGKRAWIAPRRTGNFRYAKSAPVHRSALVNYFICVTFMCCPAKGGGHGAYDYMAPFNAADAVFQNVNVVSGFYEDGLQ